LDLDPVNLFCSIVLGLIGMGYTGYGKKHNFYFFLAGISLIAITFFSLDLFTLAWVGGGLLLAPFIIRRFED